MVKKAVSWVLVGAFAFLWWWAGNRWQFIVASGPERGTVFMTFTLISLAVLVQRPRAAGTGLFDGLVGTVGGFLPSLLWFVPAVIVARSLGWIQFATTDPAGVLIQSVASALTAGISTALWYGAVVNASGDSK